MELTRESEVLNPEKFAKMLLYLEFLSFWKFRWFTFPNKETYLLRFPS